VRQTLILTDAQEEEWRLYAHRGRPPEIPKLPLKIPGVWAEEKPPGLAQNVCLVVVELMLGATLISQKQYFIPCKAQVRIQKHLNRLPKYGILLPCQSSWNTPLLLV
jgi:hypothetical protein